MNNSDDDDRKRPARPRSWIDDSIQSSSQNSNYEPDAHSYSFAQSAYASAIPEFENNYLAAQIAMINSMNGSSHPNCSNDFCYRPIQTDSHVQTAPLQQSYTNREYMEQQTQPPYLLQQDHVTRKIGGPFYSGDIDGNSDRNRVDNDVRETLGNSVGVRRNNIEEDITIQNLTIGTDAIFELPSNSSRVTFHEVRDSGPPRKYENFPPSDIKKAMVDTITYYDTDLEQYFDQKAFFCVSNEGDRRLTDCAYALNPENEIRKSRMGSIQKCHLLKREICSDVSSDSDESMSFEDDSSGGGMIFYATNTFVAVKISSKQLFKERLMYGDCRTENPWQEVAALQFIGNEYPNLLGLIDAMEDDDNLYTVMFFCREGDLYDKIKCQSNGYPEQRARIYFQHILKGLDQLQRCGVFHRDLSLENILLHDDRCVFIDFGMCLRIPMGEDRIRRLILPVVGGKVRYMSPELFCNQQRNCYAVDGPSCDLWAAGVILFLLLTGKFPYFKPDNEDDGFHCTTNNIAVLFQKFEKRISRSAVDLLQRIFQLQPSKRYTLAQVMEHPWVNG